MNVDTSLLKELRERSGAGIMDCKKALEENNNDIEKAAVYLREKGIAKAVKKESSRVSAEGVFNYVVNGNNLVIYEVNCETDFVAANEKFKNFVAEVGKVLVASGAKCTECAMEAKNEKGVTLTEMTREFIAVIGEKITIRNVKVVTKTDAQIFGIYKHFDNKTLCTVVMEGGDQEVANGLAMQVMAYAPSYLDRSSVDQAYIQSEKEIFIKEAKEDPKNANKPQAIIEKMIEGRVAKELKGICLVDQEFVLDTTQTVAQYLAAKKATVVSFTRDVVGTGIQKKENNFADEVYAQAGLTK